ncbi:hypothetical protein BOTNAR_0047g00270 [Botryotinia narcissicola]|uniref:Uncharacterized protein n=1 Tax=Botryotinia narcissicola TaxID=278944 RepID=A0A4Z1J0H5_9HELO|nr:hypothetical protein BOTNAR_0047g00270 [Botryotinia narcissicola]
MGKGKGMAGNANKEPLGSRTKIPTHNSSPIKQEKNDEDLPHFRAEGLSEIFGSIKQEGDNEYSFLSRSPLETHQPPPVVNALGPAPEALTTTIVPFPEPAGIPITIGRVPEAPKAPISVKARTSLVSPAALIPLFRPRRYQPPVPIDLDLHIIETKTLETAPTMKNLLEKALLLMLALQGVLFSDRLLTEILLRIGAFKIVITIDHRIPSEMRPSSPIEESWAEIASREHKELMATKAANITTSNHVPFATSVGESKPLKQTITLEQSASVSKDTPVSPVTDVRSLLVKRKKQSKAEGLDIQHQISSLLYPRMRKARQIPPTESKMKVTTDVEKDVGFAKSFESSAQHSSTPPLPISLQEMHSQSEALLSASDQGIHPERQGFLNDSPMLVPSSKRSSISSKSTFVTAESRLTNSPPKIKIDTQTLQSKIQEIRRASSSDEKPRPIPSIMNELPFTDDPFESDQYVSTIMNG